ncbi:HAD-IIIC family phosphatase [Polymorphospora sp. NPDC051019]|uniref:HAD-IIIC family phosphatase n=1 Tax=Polymorphospora sp. NPDC051019 TaxID=3155725 RepID=UPI003424A8B7
MQTGNTAVSNFPVVVTATFVAESLATPLAWWSAELDLPQEVTFAPYGQVFQQLLGVPAAGATVALIRPEDWATAAGRDPERGAAGSDTDDPAPGLGADGRATVASAADDLVEAVRVAAGTTPRLIVVLCPASPALLADPVDGPFLRATVRRLADDLGAVAGVHLLTDADTLDAYGPCGYADEYADRLGHVPYTPEFFTVLGTAVMRRLHALRTPRPKVLVVDADNTLWDGVVGEDGVDGIHIGPDRRALHELLVAQQRAGRLTCVSSKNAEADVRAVFAGRPEMGIGLSHLTALRADWRPKSATVRELAAELDLGLDSFVFLDDSPVECGEMRAACPEVLTVQLPADAAGALRTLRHCWPLDVLAVTDDDRLRTEHYRRERQRRELRGSVGTVAEFVAGLRLTVTVAPATPDQVERLAQLTQRTNQFNLTTVRRTAAELVGSGLECHAVEVTDRFGAYGIVGLVLSTTAGPALAVDTFLLSCRVLGRGVEHRVLAALGELALARGLADVTLPVVASAKNRPARDFVHDVAGEPVAEADGRQLFRLPAATAAGVRFRPPAAATAPPPPAPAGAVPGPPPAAWRLVERIATELRDAAALHAAVHARPASPLPLGSATGTELTVAQLWTDVLGVPPRSVHDSFFALGGQSLHVVQFMARVRAVLGVELPVELLFTPAFTVAQAAGSIDAAGGRAATDLDGLLAEVEALSDDEVAALLAAESG